MKYLVSIIIALFLFSCTQDNKNIESESSLNNEHKDSLITIINSLNTELRDKNILSEEGFKKATILIRTYDSFIETYTDDSLVENYLFDLIMYQQGLNLTNEALKDMDSFVQQFSKNEKSPEIVNMQAAIYDIEFHDAVMAKKKYQFLIKNYPNHPLAIKAKEILDNGDLDLTIEERVKKWQKNI